MSEKNLSSSINQGFCSSIVAVKTESMEGKRKCRKIRLFRAASNAEAFVRIFICWCRQNARSIVLQWRGSWVEDGGGGEVERERERERSRGREAESE